MLARLPAVVIRAVEIGHFTSRVDRFRSTDASGRWSIQLIMDGLKKDVLEHRARKVASREFGPEAYVRRPGFTSVDERADLFAMNFWTDPRAPVLLMGKNDWRPAEHVLYAGCRVDVALRPVVSEIGNRAFTEAPSRFVGFTAFAFRLDTGVLPTVLDHLSARLGQYPTHPAIVEPFDDE